MKANKPIETEQYITTQDGFVMAIARDGEAYIRNNGSWPGDVLLCAAMDSIMWMYFEEDILLPLKWLTVNKFIDEETRSVIEKKIASARSVG